MRALALRSTQVRWLAALAALALTAASPLAGSPSVSRQGPGPAPSGAATAPLPDEATFFARTRERLASNERIQARYRFIEKSTELNFNVFGKLGSGARQTFEVYPNPVRRLTYRRLVEYDGVRTPPAQLVKQDRAYLARLAEYRKTLAQEGATEREARLQRERERAAREKAQVDEITQLFTFRIDRRETVNGEPAIVVRFTPKPGLAPQSREGRVAYAFGGTAWVHEHEYQVMKIEAVALDDVSFGWGVIGRLNAGMKVLVTRMKLADGSWVPERSHFAGDGRALMLRKITIDDQRDYSGYTPYEPEQVTQFLSP